MTTYIKWINSIEHSTGKPIKGNVTCNEILKGQTFDIYNKKQKVLYVMCLHDKKKLAGIYGTVKGDIFEVLVLAKQEGVVSGIGKMLVHNLFEFAKLNYPQIRYGAVGVGGDKPQLIKYYQSLGFKHIDTKNSFKQKNSQYTHLVGTLDDILGMTGILGGGLKVLKYDDAMKYAKQVIKEHPKLKLHIAGSLLRKEAYVHDIDFITKSKLPDNRSYLRYEVYTDENRFNVDIWHTKSLLFGRLIRGYPRHVIIALRRGLQKNGYKLTNDAVLKNNKTVKITTIKQVFKLANIAYRGFIKK